MLTLLLETSSANYAVACAVDGQITAEVVAHRREPLFRGLAPLAQSALGSIGADFQDIDLIAIDNGPGNLAAVRAAVAYANGLAFSLGCSIFCADSLSLMSLEARESYSEAVLCVQNAGAGNIYAGLFPAGLGGIMRHGPFTQVIPGLARDLTAVALAGKFRCEIAGALAAGIEVSDTKIEAPDIKFLHKALISEEKEENKTLPFARPLTEESELFQSVL